MSKVEYDDCLSGCAGEFQFIADASWRGLRAAHVSGQAPYDAIIETSKGLLKVQVKIARLRTGRRQYVFGSGGKESGGPRGPLSSLFFDVLACYCVGERRWVFFHAADIRGRVSATVRASVGLDSKRKLRAMRRGALEYKGKGWEIFNAPIRPDKTSALPEAA